MKWKWSGTEVIDFNQNVGWTYKRTELQQTSEVGTEYNLSIFYSGSCGHRVLSFGSHFGKFTKVTNEIRDDWHWQLPVVETLNIIHVTSWLGCEHTDSDHCQWHSGLWSLHVSPKFWLFQVRRNFPRLYVRYGNIRLMREWKMDKSWNEWTKESVFKLQTCDSLS